VIIPTYNSCDELGETLYHLTTQRIPAGEFEVIVADDGSSDATAEVAESFSGRLMLRYCFQEDLGFRVAAARNGGARLASGEILIFLDTGCLAGADFVRRHLASHADDSGGRAVAGYIYGFNPGNSVPGLRDVLDRRSLEEVLAHYAGAPAFLDVRHTRLARYEFDLGRLAVPWSLFFGGNISLRARDFWAVGGFDEKITGWAVEDLELGFRLTRRGIPIELSLDAWAIEAPSERDMTSKLRQFRNNMTYFLKKFPEPIVELCWATVQRYDLLDLDAYCRELAEWRLEIRDRDVAGEVDEAVHRLPPGDRIAVIGAGGSVPASLPDAILLDFDAELLDRAYVTGRHHAKYHAIGLRTPLADRSVDTVIITSRLSGLRSRWNELLVTEAHRIGRTVIDQSTPVAATAGQPDQRP